jgi:hypothetical protein
MAGCSSTPNTAGKELKLGAIMPVTGAAAEKGKPGIDALLDVTEYINTELKGAAGYKINLDWKDSNYNAANVNTIVTDFTNSGVQMFAAMSSFEMTNAMGIANNGTCSIVEQLQGHPGLPGAFPDILEIIVGEGYPVIAVVRHLSVDMSGGIVEVGRRENSQSGQAGFVGDTHGVGHFEG